MSLVRALHGRHPWSELELHGQSWGSSQQRGEWGKGRGEEQGARLAVLEVGAPRGVAALGRAAGRLLPAGLLCSCKLMREEEWRKERRKRKGRKRKEKNMENFLNLKISEK
jgi:hypothetical protein